jgi:competence protein ComEC
MFLSSLVAAWIAAVAAYGIRRPRWFIGACAVGFLAAGALMGQRAVERALNPPVLALLAPQLSEIRSTHNRDPVVVEGTIRVDCLPASPVVSLSLRVERVQIKDGWVPTDGGVLISVGGLDGVRRSREWVAGRRVRLPARFRWPTTFMNPGVADARQALALRGTSLVGSVKSARLVEIIDEGSWIEETAAEIRKRVRNAVSATVGRWSARSAAIVIAILIGDRASLDDEVERRLQEAGTYHVMAISGGNIAILAGAVAAMLGLCGLRGRLTVLVSIAVLLGYAVLVGGGSSVVRATIMAVTYLSARALDHRTVPLNAVAVALTIALALDPTAIFDPGLALTYGATAGILVGARLIAARLPTRPVIRSVTGLLAASLAAEAVIWPIGLRAFGQLALAGPVLNLAAIPMMALAQVAGLIAVMFSTLSESGVGNAIAQPLSVAAGFAAHVGATVLVESTSALELAPWLAVRLPPPPVWIVLLYFVGLAAWVASHVRESQRPPRRSLPLIHMCGPLAAMAAAGWMLAAPPGPHAFPRGRLSAAFIDVGQGDATLIGFPRGGFLLVDAGGAPGAPAFDFGSRIVVPAAWARGARRLDRFLVTHGDPDHLGGGPGVVRDLRPLEIWEGIDVPRHAPTMALRALASRQGSTIRPLLRGWQTTIEGVELIVWHPARPDWERARVRNDDSLVIELRYGAVSILLTGDIGREAEHELLSLVPPAAIRVLKVPHHGSRYSSSPEFLDVVSPAIAVVSAGRDNRYGHPVADIVQEYERRRIRLFRTDRDGAVTVMTDGAEVVVETYWKTRLRLVAPAWPVSPSPTPSRALRTTNPGDGARLWPAHARWTGSVE